MKKFALLLLVVLFAGCEEKPPLGARNPATADDARVLQAQAAQQYNLPVEKTVNIASGVTMDFVLIPAGAFHMGSPSNQSGRKSDEGPVHYVEISRPFYMGKYEVTQQQYESVVGENTKIKFTGEKLPIENVDWYRANMFCKAVSNLTDQTVRLPSEAEWEYACRAGTDTPFYTGQTVQPDQANYNCTASYKGSRKKKLLGRTAKVGRYTPNAFALYDMHGNVWEWCQDIYKSNYYKKSHTVDPVNDGRKGSRVIRGGSWNHPPEKLRSADRNKRIQGADRRHIGFRVVMEIE